MVGVGGDALRNGVTACCAGIGVGRELALEADRVEVGATAGRKG